MFGDAGKHHVNMFSKQQPMHLAFGHHGEPNDVVPGVQSFLGLVLRSEISFGVRLCHELAPEARRCQ